MRHYDSKPVLYVKAPGARRFAPVDWRSGTTVVNRIHASMFTPEEKEQVERDMAHPENAGLKWEWRK